MNQIILKFFVIFSLVLGAFALSAQPKNFISGQVVDSENQSPIPMANVVLYEQGSSELVSGMTTNEEGNFFFKDLKPGTYEVKASYIGFQVKEIKDIKLTAGGQIRLGSLVMQGNVNQLQEIEVSEQRDLVQSSLGSRIYNVSDDIANQGGNAIDVLRNIPSIEVDQEGGVTLRGSGNINVLINGRQSGLSGVNRQALFERIPANLIAKIEVINNPSAKYDAEGNAGIINIILKKKQDDGWNLDLALNLGNLQRHNGSANLNVRKGKWNIFTNINANQRTRIGTSLTNRENIPLAGEDFTRTPFIIQNRDRDRLGQRLTISGGFDFYMSERSTLGLEVNASPSFSENKQFLNNRNLDFDQSLLNYFLRNSREVEDELNLSYALNYEYKFNDDGAKLTLQASYADAWEQENEAFEEADYDALGQIIDESQLFQRSQTIESSDLYLFQADYVKPLSSNAKFETGYKAIIRQIDNDFIFEDLDQSNQTWVSSEGLTNRFYFEEQVHAAYVLFGGKLNRFELEGGLRAEQTFTDSRLVNTEETFENDYLNIFPTAVITYDLGKERKIQASFTRRIDRPRSRSLNPFPSFSNPLAQRVGNPFLQAEFTNNYELEYLKDWDNASLTTAAFYRRTTGVIQYINVETPGDTVFYTPRNLNNSQTFGLELIGSYRPGRWLFLNGSFSYFRLLVDGANLDEANLNDSFSWTARMTAGINLPKGFRIQLNAFYRGPVATAQGRRYGIFFNSIGVSKDVLKDRGRISLQVRDVAQSLRFGGITNTPTLSNEYTYTGKTRTISLGFNYRFGNLDDRKRRRRGGGDREGGMDDDGGF